MPCPAPRAWPPIPAVAPSGEPVGSSLLPDPSTHANAVSPPQPGQADPRPGPAQRHHRAGQHPAGQLPGAARPAGRQHPGGQPRLRHQTGRNDPELPAGCPAGTGLRRHAARPGQPRPGTGPGRSQPPAAADQQLQLFAGGGCRRPGDRHLAADPAAAGRSAAQRRQQCRAGRAPADDQRPVPVGHRQAAGLAVAPDLRSPGPLPWLRQRHPVPAPAQRTAHAAGQALLP